MSQGSIWIVCEMDTPKRKNILGKENPMDKGKRVELSTACGKRNCNAEKEHLVSTH